MRGVLLATVLALTMFSGFGAAHEPDTFTVIVREDFHDPNGVNVVINDTVNYYNVDKRENITHIIGFDINDDGDFDDIGEFSSGVLHGECNWENDSDCRVAWIFTINDTALIGNYILTDLHSDGTEFSIYLNISADDHSAPAPNIGECYGDCPEDEPELEDENKMKRSSHSNLQKGLILGGLTLFGGASALLVAALMQRA